MTTIGTTMPEPRPAFWFAFLSFPHDHNGGRYQKPGRSSSLSPRLAHVGDKVFAKALPTPSYPYGVRYSERERGAKNHDKERFERKTEMGVETDEAAS